MVINHVHLIARRNIPMILSGPVLFISNFYLFLPPHKMVVLAQLVRVSDCDSEGRRFEPGKPPIQDPGPA